MDNIVEEELKNLKRRMDSIQKTLDLLYNDRSLLEDIVSRIAQLENAFHLNRDHQTEGQKDIKAEVQEVKASMEDKVEAVQAIVENAATEIKATVEKKDNFIEKLKKKLKGGEKK